MAQTTIFARPKRALRALYRSACGRLTRAKRSLLGTDAKIAAAYFSAHSVRKLHIGCGQHLIAGFLNADLTSSCNEIVRLDATKPFPFEDSCFDYIFSEHMIEHISYPDGLRMLRECHRVLKEGGKIRISTPDLHSVVALSNDNRTMLQDAYIAWSVNQFTSSAPDDDPAFVINNFVRNWGHQFIYFRKTLATSLERSGFIDIQAYALNESASPELRNLENEDRMPAGFLALETLTLEGTKPARR